MDVKKMTFQEILNKFTHSFRLSRSMITGPFVMICLRKEKWASRYGLRMGI